MGVSVCETKKFFDTEFEATLAAAHILDEEFVPYPCGRHWHLTHADPNKRKGFGGGRRFQRCEKCLEIFRAKQFKKHKCETVE